MKISKDIKLRVIGVGKVGMSIGQASRLVKKLCEGGENRKKQRKGDIQL